MIGSIFIATTVVELQSIINMRACSKSNKCKVIVLDDEIIQQDDYVGGSILLPPTSALCTLIDTGIREEFANQYYQYLNYNDDVKAYLATMMYALLKGTDLILFTHTSDITMFLDELVRHLMMNGYAFASTAYAFVPGIDFSTMDVNAMVGFLSSYGYDASDVINSIQVFFNGGGVMG